MTSEWKECTIGDIASVKGGKRLPKGVNLITKRNAHPYIRIRDLTEKTLELKQSYEYVDDDTQKSISRYIVDTGDILISIVGTIGLIAVVGETLNGANLTENCVKLVDIREDVDREYLYYFLVSSMGQDEIRKGTVGAVQPKLPIKNIQSIKLYLPDIDTQKQISGLLSAVDDKIALNTAINENLEQQAQALFKAWFVDFEPFGGVMPDDWRIIPLSELCDSISKKHKFNKPELIFLNTGDVENGMVLHNNYSEVSEMPGQAKKSIATNDILYSEIRPVNKHFAYVNFKADDYVVSTKLMVLRAKGISPRRLYQFLTMPDTLSELQHEAETRSGTFPQIRFDNIQQLEMIVASEQIEKEYSERLSTIYSMIDRNNAENQSLATLRDTLLPKLMNGEIDVSAIKI